jgi:hypothetical protein
MTVGVASTPAASARSGRSRMSTTSKSHKSPQGPSGALTWAADRAAFDRVVRDVEGETVRGQGGASPGPPPGRLGGTTRRIPRARERPTPCGPSPALPRSGLLPRPASSPHGQGEHDCRDRHRQGQAD